VTWALEQTNRALQSEFDVSRAYVEMIPAALPYHNERWKNWDAAIAIYHADRTVQEDGVILDAGACRDPKYPSPFLPAMQRLGFQRLYGVNLDEKYEQYENGICYGHGDITDLFQFPNGYFDFVACLSVIEHGVDPCKFLAEMSRVLRRGGHLFVSFDYWEDPIATGDRTAFGVPVKIFSRDDVTRMVRYASDVRLNLTSPLDLSCKDRVVKWLGLEYTFANLLLCKS
jgi:SAM-dependent methyltransferase